MNLKKRVKNLKAILVDVDGVLTDGGLYFDNSGNELKKFNVKDGQIVKFLKDENLLLGVITGRKSQIVKNRISELGFDFFREGVENKLIAFQQFLKQFKLSANEVAYIGDDIIDLPILKIVGVSATPKDAKKYIKKYVDIVTSSKGGKGAFRDFADKILKIRGISW